LGLRPRSFISGNTCVVVSNFRYTVFAVRSASSRREVDQHGVLPSLAGGICPGRCDLHCDGRPLKFVFYSALRTAPAKICFAFFSVTYLSHLSDILQCLCLLVYLSVYLMSHACLSVNVCLRFFIVYVSEIVYLSLSCICLSFN